MQACPTESLYCTHDMADTGDAEFVASADQMARLVLAEALEYLPYESHPVTTPTEAVYEGSKLAQRVCGVSIVRAGESMEHVLREWVPSAVVGKILIQRDEATAEPFFYFDKLPANIHECSVVLLDPMCATGGSACAAIECLAARGVKPANIVFANIVSCPEGLAFVAEKFPDVHIVTGVVDNGLNSQKYIVPGLGDYGDRYYFTA
ncbi:uncharacterized protein MONBRDRAFT_28660 [Monosiga brevicollis MX1]|uniref:uracil phosphoribosyltransferase n=1 Tax=Monosiga brevicollis TaxID=81824 RepID=A9V8T7_MONBE|nr:uncharacterized protein MONBRDRAFT_28660 [Monosiga brevicollis MX1]EDQ85930.1 predicted protein [Monosiga brevicollis MX1]|eukprot:XP_001749124.1 hypothetical protein [Monosiga brevicollis MX1]